MCYVILPASTERAAVSATGGRPYDGVAMLWVFLVVGTPSSGERAARRGGRRLAATEGNPALAVFRAWKRPLLPAGLLSLATGGRAYPGVAWQWFIHFWRSSWHGVLHTLGCSFDGM